MLDWRWVRVAALLVALGGWHAGAALAADTPPLDSIEQRVKPCTSCHGNEGRATREGYYPRIAGKPAGYLFNQLVSFRDGRRHFPMMTYMAQMQSDAYLHEIADYFGSQHVPYPPPHPPASTAAVLDRGRQLVTAGDKALSIPSCNSCHGRRLLGVAPAVPGLLGVSQDYLTAQLGAWRMGVRAAPAPDCMAQVVRRMRADDLNAVATWLASQAVPGDAEPEVSFESPPPVKCGSIEQAGVAAARAVAPAAANAGAPTSATAATPVSTSRTTTALSRPAAPARAAGASTTTPPSDPVARGRDLVALGDCRSCHTTRGGAPFAGGRPIPTPFGTFYSPNITPDSKSGLGSWSATDFWNALHLGYSKDGTLLYPTFPYTNYTKVTRGDSDAMFAYLRTIAPAPRANRAHDLRFPYNYRTLLAAWRWLYFRPGEYQTNPSHDAKWNRGAYLVQGLAHCSACHETRNSFGAANSEAGPSGGLVLDWYAPSLLSPREAGVQHWADTDIVTLLRAGWVDSTAAPGTMGAGRPATADSARNASTIGPMAEVVSESLQHAAADDLAAMASYLKSLPTTSSSDEAAAAAKVKYEIPAAINAAGEDLYNHNCADCHGKHGEGRSPAAAPLAGNRAVTMPSPMNSIRMVLFGGYAPGTSGNPRPFGMPPYSLTLSDEQIATLLDYIRTSWGNSARPVLGEEVGANRGSPLW